MGNYKFIDLSVVDVMNAKERAKAMMAKSKETQAKLDRYMRKRKLRVVK